MQEDASSSPNAKIANPFAQSTQRDEDAEKIALRLIARAEQCSAGLSRKLEMRGCDPACVAEVVSYLVEQSLVNDERYARLWLQTRVRLTRTPKRLLAGLVSKGIPRNEAQAALDTILDEETEITMLNRFAKKHKKKAGDNIKYLLKSEGFSNQAISSLSLCVFT